MGKFSSGCKSAGRARVFQGAEKKETYNKMRMIILDGMKRATKASVEFGNPAPHRAVFGADEASDHAGIDILKVFKKYLHFGKHNI